MKFVVDECTGSKVAQWLRKEGHDVISIFDDARGSDDDQVLALAHNEDRVLITGDKDFGELIFREGRSHHGVILLRLTNPNPANHISALERLFLQNQPLIDQFIVVTDAGIRVAKP
jgi:predicted nuclease of predicted toxin-antitoxin system